MVIYLVSKKSRRQDRIKHTRKDVVGGGEWLGKVKIRNNKY